MVSVGHRARIYPKLRVVKTDRDGRCHTCARLAGGSDAAPARPPPACPGQPAWAARDATARLGLNVMKEASFGGTLRRVIEGASQKEAVFMLHAGLDLSRKRLGYCLLDQDGVRVGVGAVSPDRD